MASLEPFFGRRGRALRALRLSHENKVLLLALAAGAAGVVVSLSLLWSRHYEPQVRWTLAALVVVTWLVSAFAVRNIVVRPLRTLSSLQGALREGDYSVRAGGSNRNDSLGILIYEFNALSETLRQQRLGAMEKTALLAKVMSEIELAVFTLDDRDRIRLVNRAGESLLGLPSERLLGKRAEEVGLAVALQGESAQTLEHQFPGRAGRWGVRRSTFREGGVPHHLVVISDLSRALREEERQAWQRLVRVLGHELNNSLTPVKSIAESLEAILRREQRAPDWEDDMRRGLRVIGERAEALTRFMKEYSRLARLPQPRIQPVQAGELVRHAAKLEQRLNVQVEPGPEVEVHADPDQLEQLLINVIRNGVDATLEAAGGTVTVSWDVNRDHWQVCVRDEGHGISNPANLFVPFFSTKPGGSGIGLALSRQIAEGHGGTATLENRGDRAGSEFRLRLPIHPKS